MRLNFIKTLFGIFFAIAVFFPSASAFADKIAIFKINDRFYEFQLGYLGFYDFVPSENPVALGLHVLYATSEKPDRTIPPQSVLGLEKTLKAELTANGVKQEFPLHVFERPQYLVQNHAYGFSFVPSFTGPFEVRYFGTIENNPVDIKFSCSDAPVYVNLEQADFGNKTIRTYENATFRCIFGGPTNSFPAGSVKSPGVLTAELDQLAKQVWYFGLGLALLFVFFALLLGTMLWRIIAGKKQSGATAAPAASIAKLPPQGL